MSNTTGGGLGGVDTWWGIDYNPNAPVPIHHWEMQLSTVCIVNSLTLITFVGRTWYRWSKLKRFRKEDRWIVAATISFVILYVCQLGASMNGAGLNIWNVPDQWLKPHWIFTWGWICYYLTISMTKVSLCCCLLEFLPHHFKTMRRLIIALCFFIMALAIAEALIWLFQCQPIASNFVFSVVDTSCIDIDPPRYVWSGLSIPIDIAILSVPFEVVKRTGLQPHEKKVLKFVFAANFLGTVACGVGIYGTWENRESQQWNVYFTETVFIMVNDIEIFCYALGATFPILSRFFISKSTPAEPSPSQIPRPSWLRTVTNSLHLPFQNPNSSPLNNHRGSKSRRSTYPHAHSNLLDISETSQTSTSNKSDSNPNNEFITVPQKIMGSSSRSVSDPELDDMEIAAHTSEPMVTMGGVNTSRITPIYVSMSTSMKRESGVDMGSSPVLSDLEMGLGYDVWVEGGSATRTRSVRSGNKRNLRTSALYDF